VSDLALALVVAAATAIGAGVGGAIAGYVTLRAEEARQSFQRRWESEQQDARLLVGLRVVLNELVDMGSQLSLAAQRGPELLEIHTDAWEYHQSALAVRLTQADWHAVAAAYMAARKLRLLLELDPDEVTSNDLWGCRDVVEAAKTSLIPYSARASLHLEPSPDAIAEAPAPSGGAGGPGGSESRG
jgi:hypothetical protein